MKIVISYIAVTNGPLTHDYASRFVGSYLACPPGEEHDTIIVCNGGPLPAETAVLFDLLPNCSFFPRVNDEGWDIGGYQAVAQKVKCDMLVCFGESCYFHMEGWLGRLEEAWEANGPGMYGLFSSHLARAHMNTTAFAVAPKFLLGHAKVTNHRERYEFEHGERALWRRLANFNIPTLFVTWDGIWKPRQWRYPKNILWRGDQSNLLCFCNHVDRYFAADPETKRNWEAGADQLFR